MRTALLLTIVLGLAAGDAAAEGPNVLLLTDSRGYVHDVVKPVDGDSLVRRTMTQIVEDRLGGQLTHIHDASQVTPELLDPGRTQVLVMYTTGDPPLDLDLLNSYVESGGTLLGIHCATDTFKEDPRYYELIGGTFQEHPWYAASSVVIKSVDREHPVARPIGGQRALREEIYVHKNFDPEQVRVLVVLDMENTPMKRPQVVPIAWVRQVGEGRVLYTSLGHREDVWQADWYQQHLAEGIRWLTGQVEGAVEPNPKVTKREHVIAHQAFEAARQQQRRQRSQVVAEVQPPCCGSTISTEPPADDDNEQAEGFQALFDGTEQSARDNWRGFKKEDLPEGWAVEAGTLTLSQAGAGDIITREQYGDFELRLEWRVGPGGNSGIFYRVVEEGEGTQATYSSGIEMQVLDDERHADGRSPLTSAGSLYGLYAVERPSPVNPAGEWNEVRIVHRGNHVEHWLNGQKVVEAEIGGEDWNRRLSESKFANWPRFAKEQTGYIGLQDHGDPVWYRNIRIKRLDAAGDEQQDER